MKWFCGIWYQLRRTERKKKKKHAIYDNSFAEVDDSPFSERPFALIVGFLREWISRILESKRWIIIRFVTRTNRIEGSLNTVKMYWSRHGRKKQHIRYDEEDESVLR